MRSPPATDARRHLLLVGLPGSGKTTAGRLTADLLAAEFLDIDVRIVERVGMAIEQIFVQRGEEAFRRLEREEVERALRARPAVVAPGGGWAAQPGAIQGVAGRAFRVYLDTSPEVAASRAAPEGTRPLLAGSDPVRTMRELLKEREASYLAADGVVRTDGKTPRQVASEVVVLARSRAGW